MHFGDDDGKIECSGDIYMSITIPYFTYITKIYVPFPELYKQDKYDNDKTRFPWMKQDKGNESTSMNKTRQGEQMRRTQT